jgi:hypothetical protein
MFEPGDRINISKQRAGSYRGLELKYVLQGETAKSRPDVFRGAAGRCGSLGVFQGRGTWRRSGVANRIPGTGLPTGGVATRLLAIGDGLEDQ